MGKAPTLEEIAEMDGGGKKKKRGSVNNRNRLEAFKGRGAAGTAEWATCDCHILLEVISAITELGGAITLGLSRDQGAHSLTLLLDDSRTTLWFNGDADLTSELQEVLAVISFL